MVLFLDRFKDSNKVGTIMPWPNRTTVAPTGWLLCNGSQYDSTNAEFWQLYQEIGTKYNTGGESANHFRVPNLQFKSYLMESANLVREDLIKMFGESGVKDDKVYNSRDWFKND